MVSRAEGGYRLRSAVEGLDRFREVHKDLFADPCPDTFMAEDVTLPTLEQALESAKTPLWPLGRTRSLTWPAGWPPTSSSPGKA